MKLKKLIIPVLLLIMFLPIMVKAEECNLEDISITSIKVEKKTDSVEEVSAATANGREINLNLNMSELGANIQYKMVVKNNSSNDYELDKKTFSVNSDYVNYTIESNDDSNIIEAKSSKEFYLNVEYKNPVDIELFRAGLFKDSKEMILDLAADSSVKNPNTKDYILPAIIILVVVASIVIKKKKEYANFALIIGLTIAIPLTVHALCKSEIKINSNINIISDEYYIFYIGEIPLKTGMTVLPAEEIEVDGYGDPVEEEIIFYDTYQETEEDTFIRYLVKNNVITKSQVGYIIDDKAYYLTGGGATKMEEYDYYYDDSIYFEENLNTITESLDISNCEINIDSESGKVYCEQDGYSIRGGTRGNFNTTLDNGMHCRVSDDGTSACQQGK